MPPLRQLKRTNLREPSHTQPVFVPRDNIHTYYSVLTHARHVTVALDPEAPGKYLYQVLNVWRGSTQVPQPGVSSFQGHAGAVLAGPGGTKAYSQLEPSPANSGSSRGVFLWGREKGGDGKSGVQGQ